MIRNVKEKGKEEKENENDVDDLNELSFSTINTNENEELNTIFEDYSALKNNYNENENTPVSVKQVHKKTEKKSPIMTKKKIGRAHV